MTAPAREIAGFLGERLDGGLRGVVGYDTEGYDVVFIREDVQGNRLKSEVDDMITRLRRESKPGEEQAFPFGRLDVTLRRFEDATVVHFPLSEGQGVLATLDPDAPSGSVLSEAHTLVDDRGN